MVTAGQGWHPGVVGLVAARLKERFGRPAFAIALEAGGTGTGSGRSIPGVDLGRAVRQAVADGLLLKGGGHAMAAGITLRKDALGAFRAFLEETLAPAVDAGAARLDRCRSTAPSAPAASISISRRCWRAPGPSAPAIPSRCWRCRRMCSLMPIRSARTTSARASAPATASSSTRSRSAASAQPLGQALIDSRGRAMHVAGNLAVDRWQGEERVQLRVVDVAPA